MRIETAADAPEPFFETLASGQTLLFNSAGEDGDYSTMLNLIAPDSTGVVEQPLVRAGEQVLVLDADGGGETVVAVGVLSRTEGRPALWVGEFGGIAGTWPDAWVLDIGPPASARIARLASGGVLLALTDADGALQVLAVPDPASVAAAPVAPSLPITPVILGAVAEIHLLCPDDLCDLSLRLLAGLDFIGPRALPYFSDMDSLSAEVVALKLREDGGVVLAGNLDPARSGAQVGLFEADGAIRWQTALPETEGQPPIVHDAIGLAGGSVLAVGLKPGRELPNAAEPATISASLWLLNSLGDVVGTSDLAGYQSAGGWYSTDNGLNAAAVHAGTAYVAGGLDRPAAGSEQAYGQGLVAAIGPDGAVIWTRELPGDDSLGAPLLLSDLAVLPDGRIAVAGYGQMEEFGDSTAIYAAMLDRDGTVLWQLVDRRYDGKLTEVRAMTIGPDGRIFIVGNGFGICGEDEFSLRDRYWIGAATDDGVWLWHRCLDDREVSRLNALAVGADGRLIAGGAVRQPANAGSNHSEPRAWVAELDPADGTVSADAVFGTGFWSDQVHDVAIGADGRIGIAVELSTFRGQEGFVGRLAPGVLAGTP